MKKKNKDTAVAVMGYHNSDVQDLIQNVHSEIQETSLRKSEELAEEGLPSVEEDLNNSTSWITSKYSDLKNQILSLLNAEGLMSKGSSLSKRFNQKEQELTEEKTELASKLRAEEKELKANNAEDLKDDVKLWKRIIFPIIILASIGEVIGMEQSMGAINSSGVISRILLSIGLVIGILFISKFQVYYTRKISSKILAFGFNVIMFLLAGIVFYGVAELRLNFLAMTNSNAFSNANPLFFILISYAYYLGLTFASFMYHVPKEEQKRLKQYLVLKAEVEQKRECLDVVTKELKVLPINKERELYEVYSLIKMAEKYVSSVEHLHDATVSEFILNNNLKRHDGKTISISQYKGGVIPQTAQIQFNIDQL